MTEKKEEEKPSKKTHRAYSKYVRDPIFVGLAVLCLLLAMTTFYFASGTSCPTGAVVVVDDTDVGGDVVDDTVNDTAVVDDTPPADTGDKLVIYEFSEFQCPYCSAAVGYNDALTSRFKEQDPTWEAPVPKIKEVYGDQVDIQFKHYIVHESARTASEGSECARDQGKFWEMHDIMFKNQAKLEADDIKGYAADLGLDTAKFDACLDSGEKASIVEADTALGRSLGVSGTPTFLVGGEGGWKVVGAQPFSNFQDPIDKALKGEFPEPPPKPGPSIGTFKSFLGDEVCTEDGKPVIRLFSTTWCPHCVWVKPAYDEVIQEYIDAGKIVGRHWEIDINDDTMTAEEEGAFPDSERAVYQKFNPKGSIPTFVFGCKYYRIGTPHETEENGLELDKQEFRDVIDALIEEAAA